MENTVLGIKIFDIFFNFFIYSFFGWIYESLFVSFHKKKWVNRGFLNGPIIPIYGCGATLFYILFYNEHTISITESVTIAHVAFLYMTGMLSATILEYVTSWAMEKLFHAKWWDYSDYKYNIKGRISLKASLFWGFLSVVMALFIQPFVSKLTGFIPKKTGEILAGFISVIFLSDLTVTVIVTLQLDKKLQAMEKLREELYEYAFGLKWYELREGIKGRINKSRMYTFVEEFRLALDTNYERLHEKFLAQAQKTEKNQMLQQFEERIKEFSNKYRKESSGKLQELIYKRMFNAFPNMKIKNHEGVFADLKERLKRNND